MMKIQTGEMWDSYNDCDLFLITANSFVKSNGGLVMGRGIAKEAKDRFPGVDKIFGQRILAACGFCNMYNLLLHPDWPFTRLGLFQVKFHWRDSADLRLIEKSVGRLNRWSQINPTQKIYLNFPGIGNGGLDREDVLPLVRSLPDQVTIWEKGPTSIEVGSLTITWE